MKSMILWLLVLPAFTMSACRAQPPTDNKSLLWRISGKDLRQPSYLFGTIHLLCPGDYVWTDAMKRALARCSKVCFELDMDDPAMFATATEGLMAAPGKSLRGYFTPQQYRKLSRFVRDTLGTDLAGMQAMTPMMLESLFMSKTIDCMIPISYEANIMAEAQKGAKEIIGLEAVQEQLNVFNTLPDDSVVASLMVMVDSFAQSRQQYARMIAAYKVQDLPALYGQILASKELGDDLGAFLDDRNKKWIPRMTRLMKRQPVFFAVGAGHLLGTAGVIQLLQQAGYGVTPIIQ